MNRNNDLFTIVMAGVFIVGVSLALAGLLDFAIRRVTASRKQQKTIARYYTLPRTGARSAGQTLIADSSVVLNWSASDSSSIAMCNAAPFLIIRDSDNEWHISKGGYIFSIDSLGEVSVELVIDSIQWVDVTNLEKLPKEATVEKDH